MQLWRLGEEVKVIEYFDARALLESISNHVAACGVAPQDKQRL